MPPRSAQWPVPMSNAVGTIDCRIPSDRDIAGVERGLTPTLFMTGDELLTIEIAIALVVGCTLAVCHRRAEDGDTVLVDGSRNVVSHLLHIDGNGIGARILVDVLRALSLLDFTESVAGGSALQTLDGVGVVVVEREVHRLIHPLLGSCLGQSHFSLEHAVCLVGNGGIAAADVAAHIHRDGQDGVGNPAIP